MDLSNNILQYMSLYDIANRIPLLLRDTGEEYNETVMKETIINTDNKIQLKYIRPSDIFLKRTQEQIDKSMFNFKKDIENINTISCSNFSIQIDIEQIKDKLVTPNHILKEFPNKNS